jgi:hypothetical protein
MQNMNNMRSDAFFQQFRYWDLNLLVVFEALHCEQGNVSRAAKRIGLKPISHESCAEPVARDAG